MSFILQSLPEPHNFLLSLIQANSENPPGVTTQVLDLIEDLCETNGLPLEKIEYRPGHWIARIQYASSNPQAPHFIISGHMDVVPIGDPQLWSHNPLGEEAGNYVYGRGASDMKSGIVTAVYALIRLKQEGIDLPFTVSVILTSDEETGMDGATYVKEHTTWMDSCEYLVITEPTDMRVACGQKGVFWLRVTSHGLAAHGSQPEKGKNAILAMMQALPAFYDALPKEIDPVLGPVTMNVGIIQGGKSPNVVADTCTVDLDIRLTPTVNGETILHAFQDALKPISEKTGCTFTFDLLHHLPAITSNPDAPLVKILTGLTAPITRVNKPTIMTYGTDAARLLDELITPQFVIYGPGDTQSMHKPNEKVSIAYLEQSIDLLVQAIKELALQTS